MKAPALLGTTKKDERTEKRENFEGMKAVERKRNKPMSESLYFNQLPFVTVVRDGKSKDRRKETKASERVKKEGRKPARRYVCTWHNNIQDINTLHMIHQNVHETKTLIHLIHGTFERFSSLPLSPSSSSPSSPGWLTDSRVNNSILIKYVHEI
jgi:hypothetical protein